MSALVGCFMVIYAVVTMSAPMNAARLATESAASSSCLASQNWGSLATRVARVGG